MPTKKNAKKCHFFHCKKCNFITSKKSNWIIHLNTIKHNRLQNPTMDNAKMYNCDCGKKYKHSSSLYAHKKKCISKNNTNHVSNTIEMDKKWIKMDKCPKMSKNEKIFECECGKLYKYQSGLSKHKSKCNIGKEILLVDTEKNDLKNMVVNLLEKCDKLIEQNTELANKPTTINNTQFNVMNYLNNDCKDAMNLTDFINDFTFSLKDLDLLQSKGYQEAMEKTFVKQLCDMEKTKRPIHCSDKKRKTFYVKENDVWEKDEGNKKLIGGVQKLSSTHNKTLSKWRSYNSDWSSNDKKQDFFNKSVQEFTKCDHEKEQNKIFNKLTYLSIK